ncbi:hypothetical protein, partial [Oenococcus oeni]|uniref:hypothetical protein n=1 Tax=Oenococcus oeni TaxID=1247 RepID=UPI001C5AD1CF
MQEARRRQKDANAKQTKEKYEAEASLAPSTSITLHNCSCAQLKNKLAPASVDCIITDPPYTRQAVEAGCYADLMRLAGHALKTNGILAAFASVTHMTEVVSDFRQYAGAMQYITTIVLLKNRKPIQAQPPQLRYYHGWTPLFLYAKG